MQIKHMEVGGEDDVLFEEQVGELIEIVNLYNFVKHSENCFEIIPVYSKSPAQRYYRKEKSKGE
jgi:hypothetical protein